MNHHPNPCHQSLLHTTTTTYNAPATVSDLVLRLTLISSFATIAIWANHEAAKGFSITVVNDAGKHSIPGKRFSVFYESNDHATRVVLNTSRFVEQLLYPNDQDNLQHKKQINSVTLRLAPTNLNLPAIVSVYERKPHEYEIILSPSIMEASKNSDVFVVAVLQGMARVWLWDGKRAAPPGLLNGMVEYITMLAGFKSTEVEWYRICWKDEDPRKVAGFLRFYDQWRSLKNPTRKQDGGRGEVVKRLNAGMRDGWDEGMVDDVVGEHACGSYDILTRHQHPSSSM